MALNLRQRPPQRTVTQTVPFNYDQALASDRRLNDTLQSINAQGLIQGGNLVGGYQQTLGRLGEAPNLSALPPALAASLAPAVTPELQGIIGQANQAGVSTLAQLQRAYQGNEAANIGSLVGRGILHSGAYGQNANNLLHDYTVSQYDARQKALDSLNGLQADYLSNQQDLAGQAAQATSQAQQRIGAGIDTGQYGPTQVTQTVAQPHQNPAAPGQSYTNVGGSQEPRPQGGYGYAGAKPVAAPHFQLGGRALQ